MKKIFNKRFLFALIVGLICFGFQYGIYRLANFISSFLNIEAFCPKIDKLDDLIPLVPVFVIPYIWSYIYWISGPVAAYYTDKKHFLNIFAVYILSCLIGMIIFIFFPSYIDRVKEGIYNREQHNIFDFFLQMIYDTDGKEIGFNLFPSFHCSLTTICLIATLRRKEIKLGYRIYSLIAAILIYLSVVLTKQHYFIDIIGGVGIALASWFIVYKFDLGIKIFNKPYEFFDKKINREEEEV